MNHLGHFLLTCLLEPKLRAARVVNVSGGGHRFSDGDFSDYTFARTPYDPLAGGASKCANVLFTVALSLRGHTAMSLHPGSQRIQLCS